MDIVYKDKSNPLVEVPLFELEDKETYVVEGGSRVSFDEKENAYIIIQTSALNMGETMGNLTDTQLDLYWTLMNNNK